MAIIDHNFSGKDALAYQTSDGKGVEHADVRIFRKEDYDLGNRSVRFLVGRTLTRQAGRWAHGVILPPGGYTIVYQAVGFEPATHEISVTEPAEG